MYNILDEYINFDEDEYESRPMEPLGEMATIGVVEKPPLKIMVNPDSGRMGVPYFKVYNAFSLKPGETRVARLHFFDSGMEYHKDRYRDWVLKNKDIDNIKLFLNDKHLREKQYTNWQMTKWLWNFEYGFDIIMKLDLYMRGEYDNRFSEHPSYIPSDTPMPETWIYDPPKGYNKRKLVK